MVFRARLVDRTDEHCRRMIEQSVADMRPGAIVDEIEYENVDNLNEPFRCSYQVTLNSWSRSIEDLLLLRVPWTETTEYTQTLEGWFT